MSSLGVTVLLPFKNAASTLAECLGSILNQTYPFFEVVAVNDGSTDDSLAVVESFTRRDQRIRLVHSPFKGIVSALNHGLELARAPWIARMDADDIMNPDRLERQVEFLLEQPGVHLVACRVRLISNQTIPRGLEEYVRWQNLCMTPEDVRQEIYVESPFVHPTVMFRLSTVLDLGGYREGPFPEDYELWLRMNQQGLAMAKLPEILLDWRDSETRVSRRDVRCTRESFDRLRADYLARDPRLSQERPLAFWGAGRRTRRRSFLLMAKGYRPIVWIDIDPRKIGNPVREIPVVPPSYLLDAAQRPFVLNYVASHGAREIIGSRLHSMGYFRGLDYLMVG